MSSSSTDFALRTLPEVHYHVVPAPLDQAAVAHKLLHKKGKPSGDPGESKYMGMLKAELHGREELDDDDGKELAALVAKYMESGSKL